MVVKVNSTERNERSVGVLTDFSNAMSLHDNILEELCIFNLEIKNVLVNSHLGFICNGAKFTSGIGFECNRPSVWTKVCRWVHFFL